MKFIIHINSFKSFKNFATSYFTAIDLHSITFGMIACLRLIGIYVDRLFLNVASMKGSLMNIGVIIPTSNSRNTVFFYFLLFRGNSYIYHIVVCKKNLLKKKDILLIHEFQLRISCNEE